MDTMVTILAILVCKILALLIDALLYVLYVHI